MEKQIKIRKVEGLSGCQGLEEFESLLSNDTKGAVDCVCWPEEFPHKPDCRFSIGWCGKGIGILFNVKEPGVRAVALEDNGRVWEDSCCEFFISDPSDGTYYNFELNCIGTLLAAKRSSRTDCKHFTLDQTSLVRRFSTFPHKQIETGDELQEWSLGMFIPFSLIGIDGENLPAELRLNIYKCGDLTAHPHYLSWSPVLTEKPDFHRPEYFGRAELAED